MRISRSEMPAVEMEGRIYVPGGVGNDFSIAQPNADSSRGFEIYDPGSDSWSRGERLPLGRHHMMVAALNGRIYLFGGSGPCDDSPRDVCRYNGRSWSYDPTTATWSDLAPMPFRRIAGAAVTLGDFIYIVGGEAVEGNGESLSIEGSSTLLRYDPAVDTWERLAMLNEPREHNVAVALDGRIYALGGRWLGDLRSVEVYDPAMNSWTRAAPMRKARAGFGAAVVDGRIYVAGGELIYSGDGTEIVDTVEVYDPVENRWVERFDMPLALHGVPAVGMDGVLYLIGGSQTAGGINNRGDVWAYRP